MEQKELLSRLAKVRLSANLSARELSLRIGMSAQYIAQVESGRITLSVEKLYDICDVCHFPIEKFFSPSWDLYDIDHALIGYLKYMTKNKREALLKYLATMD